MNAKTGFGLFQNTDLDPNKRPGSVSARLTVSRWGITKGALIKLNGRDLNILITPV